VNCSVDFSVIFDFHRVFVALEVDICMLVSVWPQHLGHYSVGCHQYMYTCMINVGKRYVAINRM